MPARAARSRVRGKVDPEALKELEKADDALDYVIAELTTAAQELDELDEDERARAKELDRIADLVTSAQSAVRKARNLLQFHIEPPAEAEKKEKNRKTGEGTKWWPRGEGEEDDDAPWEVLLGAGRRWVSDYEI